MNKTTETENEDAEDDDLDAEEDPLCGACAGSGEGMYDGTTCGTCRGTGVCRPERDDGGREDYEYDRWKERCEG